MTMRVSTIEKDLRKTIDECHELSALVEKNPTKENLAQLNKTIKIAKKMQKEAQLYIREKKEIARLENNYRKRRTHTLIQIGAEFCRVFECDDVNEARKMFEKMKLMREREL